MNVPGSAAQTTGYGAALLVYDLVHGDKVRLTVSGFDLAEMPGYVARLMAAPGPPLGLLELDLSNETCLNPAALAFLMRARTAVLTRRGELRLRGLQPRVRDQLAAIGISEVTRSRLGQSPPDTSGVTGGARTGPPQRPS